MQNSLADTCSSLSRFQDACSYLILYRRLLQDSCVRSAQAAVACCLESAVDPRIKAERFTDFYSRLLYSAEMSAEPLTGNIWQNHLLTLILEDENLFSLKAGFNNFSELSFELQQALLQDLKNLQCLWGLDLDKLRSRMLPEGDKSVSETLPELTGCRSHHFTSSPPPFQAEIRQAAKEKLHHSPDWTAAGPDLAAFYRQAGTGVIGRFKAFRWHPQTESSPLVGITQPDTVALHELIGYSLAREEVLNNTRNLMKGFQTNNVLLYGDRGTGKSSTVKAVLNAFAHQGLRLVEVPRAQLQEFPQIISLLRKYPQRFILFVDDLSFEDSEWNYKDLKAVLEGGLEVRPQNVVVYATSNRRHLIREKFSDRGTPRHQANADEVHAEDTTQEKLSLADRFGITVTFATPDQEQYLDIVAGLARLKGLEIDPALLRRRALQWELWQNARSGRTARQFIDYLEADLSGPGD